MANRLYGEITQVILAQLKKGAVPWKRDWSLAPGANVPCNAMTNRAYNGANTVLLWLAGQQHQWPVLRFVTYRQAKQLGGTVRAGEKSTSVIFVKQLEVPDREHPGETKTVPMLRSYAIFNVAQCSDLPDNVLSPTAKKPRNKDERDPLTDAFLASTGADIREGQGSPAFYPKADYITLPRFKDFNSGDAYYAAALHELTHWSGHSSRLNRDMQSRFKDANLYAFEEMVAELGAAFMCAEFGFSNEALNHAGYLQHWIKLLKDDVKAFLSAASRAQAAVDYLKRLALTERPAQAA